ncbi:MAG: shikimate kinase [Candidatus Ancaeobacter aquaticus]|nr:shikimate kinase [Candidatus Ancaeobacter aquaticus]
MSFDKNIILFGFMGSGKTAVGKAIAQTLGLELIEMDEIIVQHENKSINNIFKENGEPYFRQLERRIVKELAEKDGIVVSTGGGVILDEENLNDFRKKGILFSLMVSPEVVYERTKDEAHRPLLNVLEPMKKITELLEYREAFYKKADHIIDTDTKSVEDVAREVIELYKENQ